MELVRLRVKDVDPSPLRYAGASEGRGMITLREAKGDKQRTTLLPEAVRAEVAELKVKLRELFEEDRAAGWRERGCRKALLRLE